MKKFFASLAFWLVYVPLAHAQDLGKGTLDSVANQASIKSDSGNTLPVIIGSIIKIFISLLGIVFLLLTIYAGYLYLTARGDEKVVEHAKDTLKRGVIGLVIILAAYAITNYVLRAALTAATGTPP